MYKSPTILDRFNSSSSSIIQLHYQPFTTNQLSTTANMVAIRNFFTAAMALAAPISAALTASQMADNIKMITAKSQALQAPAQSITIINGPLIVIGQGPFPQIIAGFADIVSTATTAIAQMQGSKPVTATADATLIFDSFREVSTAHLFIQGPY
jgi:hypothetical protein